MISQDIRDELEQNAAWWEREYQTLKKRCYPPKPFNPEEHNGHELVTVNSYAGPVRTLCTQCREPKDY